MAILISLFWVNRNLMTYGIRDLSISIRPRNQWWYLNIFFLNYLATNPEFFTYCHNLNLTIYQPWRRLTSDIGDSVKIWCWLIIHSTRSEDSFIDNWHWICACILLVPRSEKWSDSPQSRARLLAMSAFFRQISIYIY